VTIGADPTTGLVEVDIWSDVVCPWCYIGKRRFERAVTNGGGPVIARFRSFELNAGARPEADQTLAEMLSAKYGVSMERADAMNQRVTEVAATEGLEYQLDLARPANTFDAHRLIQLATSHGLQAEMVERLMAGYFTEGKRLGDHETLAELAAEVGLPENEVGDLLAGSHLSDEVREDEALAARLGINGVPFFVFDGRLGVSGAQPAEVLGEVLARARSEGGSEP
jgi:predicted DsbA family dithiol-disulfide isomerase